MDEVKHIEGTRYIRADVAEEWKRQRDVLKEFMTLVHGECHAARRAIAAAGEEEG